jgi:hypothetical protein
LPAAFEGDAAAGKPLVGWPAASGEEADCRYASHVETCQILLWHLRGARRRHANPLRSLKCFVGAIIHPNREPLDPLLDLLTLRAWQRQDLLERFR